MLLTEKVNLGPHICGLEVDLAAKEFAAGNFNLQPFYNSNLSNSDFNKVYTSTGSIRFRENSNESGVGVSYTQQVTMKFPSNDENRSQRIESLRSIKFISIKLSDDKKILIGRNDFFQNTKPKFSLSSNEKVTQVQFTTQSIFPVGFFGNTVPYGFVYQTPMIYAEDFNKLVRAVKELNARDTFIKSGKALYLQAPENIAEQDKTENDWAITVNAAGNLVISQYDGDDADGNPTFKNEREYEKD